MTDATARTRVTIHSLKLNISRESNNLKGGNRNMPNNPISITDNNAILIALKGIDSLITINTPTKAVK